MIAALVLVLAAVGVVAGVAVTRAHHETSGPPELAALGTDAEAMRRTIVTELERSRTAVEALEQRGPVVMGLRRELSATGGLRLSGLSVHGSVSPAEGILAGDWYDVLDSRDGDAVLVIADVSGHGARAGLVALRLKHVLSTALRLGAGPAEALGHAAATFADEEERFASCAVVRIDPVHGRLTWANAGHPPPLLLRPAPGPGVPAAVRALDPTGPLLSSLGGAWTEAGIDFDRSDLLLAFSDGLTEARSEAGAEFGTEGIVHALSTVPGPDPAAAVAACLSAARAHAEHLRRDDVTVVAVARSGTDPARGCVVQLGPPVETVRRP